MMVPEGARGYSFSKSLSLRHCRGRAREDVPKEIRAIVDA